MMIQQYLRKLANSGDYDRQCSAMLRACADVVMEAKCAGLGTSPDHLRSLKDSLARLEAIPR